MSKTKLNSPLMANVPSAVVKKTMTEALSVMFEESEVHCQKHKLGNELVIVMMANGVCATLHVQEINQSKTKGGVS